VLFAAILLVSRMEWWNSGILEYWVWKEEKAIFYKKYCIYILWWCPSIFCFRLENTPLLRENQYNYIRFDSLNPLFHCPRTHDSNIPEFQHSNWGEAPNLIPQILSKKKAVALSPAPRLKNNSSHIILFFALYPAFELPKSGMIHLAD